MTDLDARLDHLRQTPVPEGPDPAEVRTRAVRRKARRHRRYALAALPVIVLVVIAAAVATTGDDGSQSVITGSDPTTSLGATPTSTTIARTTDTTAAVRGLGDVTGLVVTVTPSGGLTDGQVVRVEVSGGAQLESPVIVQCRGDVTAETALDDCDLRPLELSGSAPAGSAVAADQQVVVRRELQIASPAGSPAEITPYDCATEPAGCVLVVGEYTSPTRGAAVPLTFLPGSDTEPAMSVTPATGLRDGEDVQVEASGLRPNSTYGVTQCASSGSGCHELDWPGATTDAKGTLRLTSRVHAAIYGWTGRIDCTTTACDLRVRTEGGETIVTAPIALAPGETAPVPRLSLTPGGPYAEDQVISVSGTGFPPGYEISGDLGICPVGKDTAVEERCGRPLAFGPEVVIGDDGTFTTTMRLFPSSFAGAAGNQLGWVIPHGPTLAAVPITFG